MRNIASEIEKRHDESVERLQEWVKHPALAAEDRGMDEGCDLMMRLARDAGFQKTTRIETDGHPGVFATLDAGAAKTVAVYFMYDVKQADPRSGRRHRSVPRSSIDPDSGRSSS